MRGEMKAERENRIDRGLPPLLERLFDEEIARVVLPNGLTVLCKEDHGNKLVSAQLWVRTGSIHEDQFLGSGLSHFLEHMIFKGTEERPGAEISRQVQAAGGSINAYTTFDRTVYYIDLPSESISLAVEILADAVFRSSLPPQEAEKERGVILREIDMSLDDPDHTVARALFRNAYRKHPYQYPVIGHREVFALVTIEDLAHYYGSRYLPNNAVLVVVGDFDTESLLELVVEQFGEFARRSLPAIFIAEEPPQLARREEHLLDDVNVCRGGMGFKTCGLSDSYAPALDVLANVLGGGHSSLLWKKLRDEMKLVHQIDASSWCPGTSGLFWISYLCDEDKREAVEEAVTAEIAAMADRGIDSKSLEKARRQALVGEVNIRKTMSGQASRLGLAEVVIGDLGYPRNYFRLLNGVSPETLEECIETYLRDERLTAVSLNRATARGVRSPKGRRVAKKIRFEAMTLRNGARLLHCRNDRLPKVHIAVASLGGPLYEAPDQRGVTGLLATLLTRDTKVRDAAAVAEQIEQVGGAFSEFAGENTFGLSIEVMSEDIDLALDLLEGALLEPTFRRETFELERNARLASLREDLDEIVAFGRKRLRRVFFGRHPFHTDSCGREETLRSLSEGIVRDHFEKLITGPNVVLSVAGDFDEGRYLHRLGALLERLPDRSFTVSRGKFQGPPKRGDFQAEMDREQAVVFQAYRDRGITHREYHHGDLLAELLREMSGQLFIRVREMRSLAYFVGATRLSGTETGMFYFYAGTHPETYGEVFDEFDREIGRIQDGGLEDEEVSRSQRVLKARRRMSLQSLGYGALQSALNLTYGLPVNDWIDYDERIDSVSAADLRRFAIDHLGLENRVRLVVKRG